MDAREGCPVIDGGTGLHPAEARPDSLLWVRALKLPFFQRNDNLPFELSGKPDRVSQTLFGKYGEDKRWEALDAISSPNQPVWHKRLLLWTLASESPEMRERAWELLDHQRLEFELLVQELSCPMWQVRVGAIRLIAKSGRLDVVRMLIAGIEDYHQNVIDETKRSLNRLIENAKARAGRGELSSSEVSDALHTLFQPLYASKRSPRFQALQFLFKIAPLDERQFWDMYLGLELQQYSVLHEEFIRYQREGSLDVLYRGLLQQNEAIIERLTGFIAVAVRNSGENVNFHLQALQRLRREDFVKLAIVLQHYRILVEFQGLIKHMNPPERIVLFDLLEAVGAEQNLNFLLRCLDLDDSKIRIRVLKILGESPHVGLRPEVFDFLTDSDEQLLLATLRYLQKKGDLSILGKITHLTRSKKKKVRNGVIDTMFKISRDSLLRDFDKIPHPRRIKVLNQLQKMKPAFLEEMRGLGESPEESDRLKFLKILDAEETETAVPIYREMTRDTNPKVRSLAVMGFKRIEDDTERYRLIKPYFKDGDPRVRANAVELLPDSRPENGEMVSIARSFAQSKHLREKANSIAKLINWGFREYESNLIAMLDSDDEWTKTSALWVLGETDLPHLTGRLREAANDPRPHVREMAVRGIGLKGSEDDLRALMPFLKDPERNVRLAAQNALRNRLHLSFEIA